MLSSNSSTFMFGVKEIHTTLVDLEMHTRDENIGVPDMGTWNIKMQGLCSQFVNVVVQFTKDMDMVNEVRDVVNKELYSALPDEHVC